MQISKWLSPLQSVSLPFSYSLFFRLPLPLRLLSFLWSRCSFNSALWVQPLGREDPLEKEMATPSSVLAWRIPGTEEPGGLQSTGSQSVRHDSACITEDPVSRISEGYQKLKTKSPMWRRLQAAGSSFNIEMMLSPIPFKTIQ